MTTEVSREVALVDLLDRLLSGGAVITGDLVLSIADVDLVHISLNAVIRSVEGGSAPLRLGRPDAARSGQPSLWPSTPGRGGTDD
jgi:Gas vesicle protein